MSRLTKDSSLPGPSASTSQEDLESGASSAFNRTLKVTLLSSEWRSTKGGLSTINRELAIQLAKHPDVEVCMYLPRCSEEDKRAAACHKVHLIEAEEMPGYDPVDWLATIPKYHVMDCVIGHGVHLGRQVPHIKRVHGNCKWIQLVHTDPEELGMFKSCADPISKGEKKHQAEVKLCKLADQVVAVGSKLAEAFAAYLRPSGNDEDVLNLTPGIFTEFKNVRQAPEERKTFRVLVFGCGDSEDFQLKGYDIAAKAIAELKDMPQTYKLVFVGAPVGEEEKVTELLLKEGIARTQLTVRHFGENREHLAKLFCEIDLAIMPSRSEGFGLAALEALSAGLPVLVSGNSGFGEALRQVPFGTMCVVNSEDPKEWAQEIRKVCEKDRALRLKESKLICGEYAEKYNWQGQCDRLVTRMLNITFGLLHLRLDCTCERTARAGVKVEAPGIPAATQQPQTVATPPASIHAQPVDINVYETEDIHTTQQVMNLIAVKYFKTVDPSKEEETNKFVDYMEKVRRVLIVGHHEGSLIITLQCSSLQILEQLWEDYCTGHLNKMAQQFLVTEDILEFFGLAEVKLTATIFEEEYRACREYLLRLSGATSNQENVLVIERHVASPASEEGPSRSLGLQADSSDKQLLGQIERLSSPSETPAPKQCKMLAIGPKGSSNAQASESGNRPSSSSDASPPKKRKMLTAESEGWDITTLAKMLKTLYRRRSQLRPLIADRTIQLELENIYTRLKIISRPKADDPSSGKEVNVYDLFGAYEKGEDVMALAEGSPGIGKTTLCLKLAYDWAVESVTAPITFSKFELVLLLKCRDIDGDIMEAISEQLLPKDINEERRKAVLDFIKDIHNQERTLIILDGLDELPQKSKRDVDKLLDKRILPFCCVFATCCQERGIEMRKNFKFDILLEIKGFTESDACEYIRKHFKHLGPDLSSKGEKLIQEIKGNTFLHALRNNPLNLLLLCVIYEDYEGKLPSSCTKLYHEIVQYLLRRYCAKHDMKAPKQDRDLEKQFETDILALGKLAWKCLLEHRHSFLEDELKEMEKRNENLVARGLGLLYKKESLKKPKPQHEYCFLHKTFQEYLAACYITQKLRRKKFNVFDHLAFDDLVGEYPQVFLFVSGLLGEEASLLFEQIGKELEGHWNWEHCNKESADFFIKCFGQSENGEQMAITFCSFIPFPLDVHLDFFHEDSLPYSFAHVLKACKCFSNLQTPVNLSCTVDQGSSLPQVTCIIDFLDSCKQLKTFGITSEVMFEELANDLFHSLATTVSLSQLILEVEENISSDTADMIESHLTKSKSLTQVALKFPGVCSSGWLSVLETGLTADSPLTAAVLTVDGPMNETGIQALEKLLSNESLTSLSFTFRGDMQDLLAAALSRGLAGQISISCLDLCVEGNLSYCGAKLLERGLLENNSLNDLKVFVHGELPKNWKTVVENVRLAKRSQAFFHPNVFSKVTTNQVLPFRPFAVKEGFCPNQRVSVNVCGELTIEGADALCEVLCPSLSRLTIHLYGKLTDGVSHLSTRCTGLKKSLSSVKVNIWGKLTEEEKSLSHDITDKNPAITLNVHDVPILQDDASNEVNVTIGNPASLATLFAEVKNSRKEKLSLTIDNEDGALVDWFDDLGEDSTLKELTLTINNDTFESEEWSKGWWDSCLGDGLKRNTSIRRLNLTVNCYGYSSGEWGMGLGDGLKYNTSISELTLTVNHYAYLDGNWGVGLGDGLKCNTSICRLILTVNCYGYSSEEWGMGLGDGLKCNTSIRELTLTINSYSAGGFDFGVLFFQAFGYNRSVRALTLTINNYDDLPGLELDALGVGLARSKSLTSCNLAFNMHGKVEEDYLPKLCEHLMRSNSLTTLTLQVNDHHLSNGSRDYDLSKVLVKSRSLSSIDLIVSFYGTETNT